jgi:hypothetical protein
MDPTPTLGRRFEAVIFDWDATAVYDRSADAAPVCDLIHCRCANGLNIAVVSGIHLDHAEEHLRARPSGRGDTACEPRVASGPRRGQPHSGTAGGTSTRSFRRRRCCGSLWPWAMERVTACGASDRRRERERV